MFYRLLFSLSLAVVLVACSSQSKGPSYNPHDMKEYVLRYCKDASGISQQHSPRGEFDEQDERQLNQNPPAVPIVDYSACLREYWPETLAGSNDLNAHAED